MSPAAEQNERFYFGTVKGNEIVINILMLGFVWYYSHFPFVCVSVYYECVEANDVAAITIDHRAFTLSVKPKYGSIVADEEEEYDEIITIKQRKKVWKKGFVLGRASVFNEHKIIWHSVGATHEYQTRCCCLLLPLLRRCSHLGMVLLILNSL